MRDMLGLGGGVRGVGWAEVEAGSRMEGRGQTLLIVVGGGERATADFIAVSRCGEVTLERGRARWQENRYLTFHVGR
jgi:hypothetical protein